MLSPQNRKSYIYIIYFEDGYFYYGVRLSPKGITPWEDTKYVGSPATHKDKWKTTLYKKFILKVYDDWKLAQEEEKQIIRPHLNNSLCLNENVGGRISLYGCSKGGLKNLESGHIKKLRELNLESGHYSRAGKIGGKIAGKRNFESGWIQELGRIQGRKNVESGHLKEIAKLGGEIQGRIQGKKNVESGHIYSIATEESCKKGASIINSQKWKCLVTGHISSPGPLSLFQKKRGIDTNLRERIE